MAIYKVPGQNLEFKIPDIGQVYKNPNDAWGSAIFARVGNTIKQLNLQELGRATYGEEAFSRPGGQFYGQSGAAESAGRKALKEKYGIDFNTIQNADFNIADIGNARNLTGGGVMTAEELKGLLGGARTSGEVVTQTNSPLNPHASDIRSNLGGGISINKNTPQQNQARAIAENAITPQSIEDGIKNLQTPAVLTPQQQKDYFASQNNANPLSPLDWLNKINSDSSKSATPLPIAPSTSTTTRADSTAAGADATAKGIQDYIKSPPPPESATSDGVKSLLASITTDFEGLKGRGTAQLSAEDAQGVNAKKQILQNAQTELNQKLAEYKAIQTKYEALNTNIEGKAITMNSIIGSQAQVERAMRSELNMKSSEIAMIQANVAGAQGNLTLAQDAADRAVNLKYQDALDSIKIRQEQLSLWQGQLDQEEEVRSQAIKMYLQDQQNLIEERQSQEKALYNFNIDAMSSYPSASIKINDPYEVTQRKITNSREYRVDMANRQRIAGGSGGVGGGVSSLTQSIINNPSLFDDLTPTKKGEVIAQLQASGYDTTNIGVKGLSDTAIKEISQTQKALEDLVELRAIIENNSDLIGPITGLQMFNPYSKARKIQSDIDRVRQTVGKALEGGVLRKEDEEKYKKILATLTDTPSTALYKIDSLFSTIQRDVENYKSLQRSSGKSLDVGAALQKKGEVKVPPVGDLRSKYNY